MLGIMHSDRDDAAALVLDMMEPERPKVDRAVMAFHQSEALRHDLTNPGSPLIKAGGFY
jgi:CRISPR/Cas system-associated endonuclease Cas1